MIARAIWWTGIAIVLLAVWQYSAGDVGNIVDFVWSVINVGAYYVMQIITAISTILADLFGSG